jgi:hypothetical protein
MLPCTRPPSPCHSHQASLLLVTVDNSRRPLLVAHTRTASSRREK